MKKTGRRKKKEEGLVLKFDAEERKEFLTGFRKRKLQRNQGSKSEKLNKQTILITYRESCKSTSENYPNRNLHWNLVVCILLIYDFRNF